MWSIPDQGPKSWYMLFYIYIELGLFGWVYEDPLHRTCNDIKLALRAAGVWLIVLETSIAINLASGPFDGAMLATQLVEAMQKYVLITSFRDAPLQSFYERVCRDLLGGDLPLRYDTAPRVRDMFDGIKTAACFMSKGNKTRLGVGSLGSIVCSKC